MHYFYVLYSLKDGRLYKGYSSNLIQRILQHGAGRNLSTKSRRPLILLYFEEYEDKSEAHKREAWAKTLEGGAALRKMLTEKGLLNEDGKINDRSALKL